MSTTTSASSMKNEEMKGPRTITSPQSEHASHSGACFHDIFEIVLEYLREWVFINSKDEFECLWFNDLRLQAFRYWHTWGTYIKIVISAKKFSREILLILHKLGLLNKKFHASATRVQGRTVAFHAPCPTTNVYRFDLRPGNPSSLGDHTRELIHYDMKYYDLHDDERAVVQNFLDSLSMPNGSSHIVQLEVEFLNIGGIGEVLVKLLESAAELEELCLFSYTWTTKIIDHFFGAHSSLSVKMPNCASLRVIRLKQVELKYPSKLDLGLPSELAPLRRFKSLKEIHLYNTRPERPDTLHSIQKLAWTRSVGDEFILESAWLTAHPFHIPGRMSVDTSEMLSKALNVTLRIESTSDVAPKFLSIWSRSPPLTLTIATDFFPSSQFLADVPSAVESLIVTFDGLYCPKQPSVWDQTMADFLQRSQTKNVRICINMVKKEPTDTMEAVDNVRPSTDSEFLSEELFTQTRALCFERGGDFVIDRLFPDEA
ncbi:hypothetical protein SCHPADRAFT_145498 [Schizopora paradoxa]|uniref:Uncharacterized protein n=1 Tax=Schizopora paradoxa TaxID=27342 RepID=A0A0H2S1X1_9AGAM|nr:hypothetical protein SCHPADRAFT_145498 [Schizopora paradoxa]